MNRLWKTGMVIASLALVPTLALSQGRDRFSQSTVLVTPEGDLLGFIPEQGEVVMSRDRMGRRVLIDNYGNLVATEMPAETFFPRARGGNGAYPPPPSAYPQDGTDQASAEPDWNNDGLSTGSLNDVQPIERQPLEPYPDESGSSNDDAVAEPAIEPRPSTLPVIDVTKRSKPEITALQVYLDREGISPGVIDGRMGDNVTKAIAAWQTKTGETLDPNNIDDILERLRLSGGMAVTTYEITPGDAAGPFVAQIPEDYSEKALLPSLAYSSTAEMVAERFHMDENYLRELNPGIDFTIPGTLIKVVDPGKVQTGKVAKIVADKRLKQVFAYDDTGAVVAAYPASIGSSDTPSPSGTVNVERVALNPGYTYNPKINFQQGTNDKVLNIPPGPNGPVGTVWMALSKPTYGIHGTPEPSKIGRTQSHGCIRLTNWDATELAKMVSPGVVVEFID